MIKKNLTQIPSTECKAIVPAGFNLGLTLDWPRYSKLLRAMIYLPNIQFSICIGLMLSDGYLRMTHTNGKNPENAILNARLSLDQAHAKFDFFFFVFGPSPLFSLLGSFCPSLPTLTRVILNGKVF